ncbi:General alpha-glucoside permease [Lachnellula suecica]|uniref:General alpha-glucoside permease n=1 Tax=Lachnellula suecica TaxID=602035 RepID=A0A8T9C5W8_9HELO|nr:General alpha-glucoside permease [Lachnellula suecica]
MSSSDAKDVPVSRTEISSAHSVQLSTWQLALKYKTAVFWSAFIGLASINWGMDTLLSNGVIAVPSFQRDFGYDFHGKYIISASWQIAFNTASSIGGFFGAIGAGYLASKLGNKRALAIACIISIGGVFIQMFARSSGLLMAGKVHPTTSLSYLTHADHTKLINGLSLGAFLTISSSYSAEACPTSIRGFTLSGVQLSISIGQLAANLILKGTGTLSNATAYRLPFALQFFFPAILLIGLPFCPESPWHLARTHQDALALTTLARLGYSSPANELAEMSKTFKQEEARSSSTSYFDCFRGSDLRRTEVAMGIFSVAQLTGVVFAIGYSSYFFQLAGLSASDSFSLSVGVSVLGLVGVLCSWFIVNRAGRRSSSFVGTAVLTGLLFLIGVLDVVNGGKGAVYGQVTCVILFAFVYLLTIGPMGWTLFAEVSSARLRSRTVGLGIVVQNSFGVLMNIVVPLLINPDAADLGGKIGFIFGGTALVSVLWVYLRVPETAGRSFEELDWLFESGVPARRFKGYDVPLFPAV